MPPGGFRGHLASPGAANMGVRKAPSFANVQDLACVWGLNQGAVRCPPALSRASQGRNSPSGHTDGIAAYESRESQRFCGDTGSSRGPRSDQLRRSRLLTSESPHSTTPAAPTSIQEKAVQGVAARAPHAAVAVPTTRVAKSGLAYQKTMAGTPARGPKTPIGGCPRNDAMRCEPARRAPGPSAQTSAVGVTRPTSHSPALTTMEVRAQADTGTARWASAVSRYEMPRSRDVPELSACSRRPSH